MNFLKIYIGVHDSVVSVMKINKDILKEFAFIITLNVDLLIPNKKI